MKLAAILLDTCRELLYRKTLIVYAGLVTLTLLFFVLALETDVANGVIASIRLFGLEGHAAPDRLEFGTGGPGLPPDLSAASFVRGVQLAVAFVLYPLGILLSVFATASLVPRMLQKGAIDLLLSKPVSRPWLFAARYLGALLVASVNLIYLVGGLGVILGLKTGIWNGGFILSGVAMSLYFACLLGFLVLAGVLFRSTTIAIMVTAILFFAGLVVRFPHQNAEWSMLITGHAWRLASQVVVEVLYHILPRTYDFGRIVTALILHEGEFSWGPVFNSVASGAGALGLAMVYFRRADF